VEFWRKRDPIKKLREDALAARWCEIKELEKIEKEVNLSMEDAVQFALNSPEPRPDTALDKVFCQ
jgi:pyruvate dehydrogenase E1 component alpha subunit